MTLSRRTILGAALGLGGAAAALLAASGLLFSTGRSGTQAAGPPPLDGDMAGFDWFEAPRRAPDVPFRDAEGRARTFADFPGQVLLVNFWATWCAPCVEEMPALDRLQAAKGSERFQVIAVSQDRDGAAKAGPFMRDLGLGALALYTDADWSVGRALEMRGLPTTFLIDTQGRLRGRYLGPAHWDGPDAARLIDWALEAL